MSNYVSLEMAKQLEGLFPDAEYKFYRTTHVWQKEQQFKLSKFDKYKMKVLKNVNGDNLEIYPAPSIAELLERLPKNNHIMSRHNFIICPYDDGFAIYFYDEKWRQHAFEDKSLAEALGKMFLHLHKEGVIK